MGYTNAGKSTLLNRLCESDVLGREPPFSTPRPEDPTIRPPRGEMVLLTDTVGFVRKLPHQVVEAFRSTLEVVLESTSSSTWSTVGPRPRRPDRRRPHRAGRDRGRHLPELLVVNKADALGTGDDETTVWRRRGCWRPTRDRS